MSLVTEQPSGFTRVMKESMASGGMKLALAGGSSLGAGFPGYGRHRSRILRRFFRRHLRHCIDPGIGVSGIGVAGPLEMSKLAG
jgi:hypothetical protein